MTTLKFNGIDALRRDLRNLPRELAGDGGAILLRAGNNAKAEMVPRYKKRTGNLASHVTVKTVSSGAFGARVVVKNSAKHAGIYENGTQTRQTRFGANRGVMPPGHVFVPAVIRARRTAEKELRALLTRKGLQVSG